MQPTLSKVPALQASLPDAIVHEPSSDPRLLSASDSGLEEGAPAILSADKHHEGISTCFDAAKVGQASGERVPLSVLSPSEGTSVDSGIQDSIVMKERVSRVGGCCGGCWVGEWVGGLVGVCLCVFVYTVLCVLCGMSVSVVYGST